jgi:hypothetical protein
MILVVASSLMIMGRKMNLFIGKECSSFKAEIIAI